jgi:hypothetical protein
MYQDKYGQKLQKARRIKQQSAITSIFKFIIIAIIVIAAAWAVSKFVFGYELTDLITRFLG